MEYWQHWLPPQYRFHPMDEQSRRWAMLNCWDAEIRSELRDPEWRSPYWEAVEEGDS